MAKPSLACSPFLSLSTFHRSLLLPLVVVAFDRVVMVALSDGPSALMILLTAVLLLTFAVQMALLLAQKF